MASTLLEVSDLGVRFGNGIQAVDGVSFGLSAGESFGVVGESGAGKTTLLRAMVGLVKPTAGAIRYDGADIATLRRQARKRYLRNVHLIFQNPYRAFHPRMTVAQSLAEPLLIHDLAPKEEHRALVAAALREVGLDPAFVSRYPHQFSGGQRQRLVLARALVLGARLLLADEPVSALDVSIQAQVLNLLRDLKDERGLTFVVVAHDLAVVRYLCDRVAVMLDGRFVEIGRSADLYSHPKHPYTQALLASAPSIKGGLSGTKLARFAGEFDSGGELTEVGPGHFVVS
ncbi:ATP-binding cassette domain-containing protein [Actinophytocola sp.]|jgi:ABC-type oligopeptide transport system ATPase subunit|uniref:ATP-binding cassette domain-containing protein n=1 Tax=Actinophytocola sp. TaxID=1872138 RepID=UPI002EDA087A